MSHDANDIQLSAVFELHKTLTFLAMDYNLCSLKF